LDSQGGSVAGPVKSLDDTPPQPIIVIDAVDTPGDDGGFIDILWQASADEEIQRYNFYLSAQLIDSKVMETLEPVATADAADIKYSGDSVLLYEIPTSADLVSFYVAVTAVDFGGNNSGLDGRGRSVVGPVQSVSNTVKLGADTNIFAGFDPDTSVFIPAGAMGDGEIVDISCPDESTQEMIEEADQFLERSHIDPQIDSHFADTVRKIEASTSNILKSVRITLSYTDIAEMQSQTSTGTDSVFALSQDDELSFRIFKLNERSRVPRWELVSGTQKVSTLLNTVSVEVRKFGVFRIARLKLPETLDRVVIYPNPFIPSQSLNGYITFKNLTENVTLQIYNMAGEKIRTIQKFAGGDEVTWDARNSEGDRVASGTYVCLIQSAEDTFVGKVVILR
jgi:hypothetical protein